MDSTDKYNPTEICCGCKIPEFSRNLIFIIFVPDEMVVFALTFNKGQCFFPSLIRSASLPTITATAELQRGNASKAIDLLTEAEPYDLSEFSNLSPIYIRGQAYLRLHSSKEAEAEFRKLLGHTGINALSPRHALARLDLARAFAVGGDVPRARKACEDFLAYWSEADPELPILRQARAEFSKLK